MYNKNNNFIYENCKKLFIYFNLYCLIKLLKFTYILLSHFFECTQLP